MRLPRIHLHVAYSRPLADDRPRVDYDSEGRVTGMRVADLLPDLDARYYLCGPGRFMADIQSDLEARGVCAERIHTESFGPVGCKVSFQSVSRGFS